MLNAAALWSSLLYDFAVKAMRQGDVYPSTLLSLPYVNLPDHALLRVLQLNCVTEDYADLWNRNIGLVSAIASPWQSMAVGLGLDSNPPTDWRPACALRSPLARRLATIEIDVLIAQELGLELENLLNLLTAFPVLIQNEAETFFDQLGKVVWTTASGFQRSGYQEDGRRPDRKKWEGILAQPPSELTCTAIDDTMPGGPRTVIRHFVGPFTQCDRIEDYRRAWAHFERLKSKDAA
ncbi:hypothetical protein [Tateyamaria pelophila]|uniref:hypothetical protein n=1 Tax=Tateyamaria pelophila TaxID=328415 RepID=UPI001CBD66D0|nr:hypothetical protein [Tateyamaria pelophila]